MTVAAAASGIILRSERQADSQSLEQVFVDTGVIAQLLNRNSQILFGRRGTGKSHVFRVLASRTDRQVGEMAVYLDLRTLGSAQLVTDPERGLTTRTVGLFKDLLSRLQSALLDRAVELDGRGFEAVSELADAIRHVATLVTQRETTDEWQELRASEGGSGLKLSVKDLAVDAKTSRREERTGKRTGKYSEVFESTVVFAEIAHFLHAALNALGVDHLLVLLDEWPSIPADAQPFVAEFVRRTLLASPAITVKIASLEYRSRFWVDAGDNTRVGFELGGDIFANLDLDDYYSYDRNSDRAVDVFRDLLYRHLVAGLPDNFPHARYGDNADGLIAWLFADLEAFGVLVQAGEGVVRDFLGIFTHAYFRAMRSNAAHINVEALRSAALEWFDIDKLPNLDDANYTVYQRLVDNVARGAHPPYFALERAEADHKALQSLFDFRLIHLVRRGLRHQGRPGSRYHLYALDFGAHLTVQTNSDGSTPRPLSEPTDVIAVVLDPAVLEN